MSKRWSKLKKAVENLSRPGAEIRLEMYRMKSQRGSHDMPVFTIFQNKEIVWRFPRKGESGYPYIYFPETYTDLEITEESYFRIDTICNMLRTYIDTPKDRLKSLEDSLGLYAALRTVDRRIKW